MENAKAAKKASKNGSVELRVALKCDGVSPANQGGPENVTLTRVNGPREYSLEATGLTKLTLTVKDPAAHGRFMAGREYVLTIRPA